MNSDDLLRAAQTYRDAFALHFPWEAGEDGRPVTRIAHVPVGQHVMESILRDGLSGPLRIEGLPEDATLTDVYYDWLPRCFMLRFHSQAFDPVPENVIPPTLMLAVTLPQPESQPETDVRESVEREIAGWWGE